MQVEQVKQTNFSFKRESRKGIEYLILNMVADTPDKQSACAMNGGKKYH